MKPQPVLLCLLPLLILGCSSREKKTPPERILLREGRVTPGVGVTGLKLGMKVSDVVQSIGPAQITTNATGTHVDYPDLGVYALTSGPSSNANTPPKEIGNFIITKITCGTPEHAMGAKFQGRTNTEIGIGNSQESVERAYGPAPSKTRFVLNYPQLGIEFGLQDERVIRMTVYPPLPATTSAPAPTSAPIFSKPVGN